MKLPSRGCSFPLFPPGLQAGIALLPHVILHHDQNPNPLGPYSVQSVGAAKAVSWAIGHNPGWVATSTQDTRMAQSSQQAGTHFADLGRMTGSQPRLVLIQQPNRI